jgi:cytochrome c oxidase subunit 2
MPFKLRPRWPATRGAGAAALTVALLALSGCQPDYPNSVFHSRTEFNRTTDSLFQLIINLGVIVFIFVFVLLLVTMWKYRSRPGQREPEHVHGNTTLEILWTVIPAAVLLWIAVPTVKAIFETQAPAPAGSLQVEVIGHQWWWEFKYPELGITTANELYLPKGRTVNFHLKTVDVIHSFWIPALGGKRDLIANRTNYIWFTPDSLTEKAFNGACVEYCGASHANMRFRAFVVDPTEFDSWAAHQKTQSAVMLQRPAAPAPASAPGAARPPATAANNPNQPMLIERGAQTDPTQNMRSVGTDVAGPQNPSTALPSPGAPGGTGNVGRNTAAPAAGTAPAAGATLAQAGYSFPTSDLPKHVAAYNKVPEGLTFDDALLAQGDAARGADLVHNRMGGGCIGCHAIGGTNLASTLGPNLTHLASRNTIAAGLYPNDAKHLALWIKNARKMKAGVTMPTIGANEIDPVTKKKPMAGPTALTDAQIADVVAYLRRLK